MTASTPVLRVAAAQVAMRVFASVEAFEAHCAALVSSAAEQGAALVVLPEFITNGALPFLHGDGIERVRALSAYTARYLTLFDGLARRFSIDIVAGTHLELRESQLHNVARLFGRDGAVREQLKVHPTPWEREQWGVVGGNSTAVFDYLGVKAAILVCYDVEFPELVRIARADGARLLLVPYNTENRQGHIRVRTCAHARAIENNVHVVLAGMAGSLWSEGWSEPYYARSAILTPSDIPFARDGVAAEADSNDDAIVVADLDFTLLDAVESRGAVRTWPDRRLDLYAVDAPGPDGRRRRV